MAADFTSTGAFSINGQFATSLRYEARQEEGQSTLQLRFMNGRTEIARTEVGLADARELLGSRNLDAIEKVMRKHAEDPAQGAGPVKGELRGRSLEYRQVMLADYQAASTENAIHQDSRVRGNPVAPEPAAAPSSSALHADAAEAKAAGAGAAASPAAPKPPAGRADTPQPQTLLVDDDREAQSLSRRQRASAVPDSVAQRFLKIEDKFYFMDKTLAFVDKGVKLKAESDNLEVVRSLVAIAEARDWQAISVTGTRDFRRQVWREAGLRGIDAHGYEPTELERQELRRAQEKRFGANEVSAQASPTAGSGAGPTPSQPTPSAAPAAAAAPTQPRQPTRESTPSAKEMPARDSTQHGVLLAHGAAPYKFDKQNDPSYYVTLRTDRGERTLWGLDLQRAITESQSGAKVGDQVGVVPLGERAVAVTTTRPGPDGQLVETVVPAKRRAWALEKSDFLEVQRDKAQALRGSDAAQRTELLARNPELASTVAALWLGEQLAKAKITRPEDQERFVTQVQESLAERVAAGQPLQPTQLLKEAAAAARRQPAADGRERPQDEPVPQALGRSAERAAISPRTRVPEAPQHVR